LSPRDVIEAKESKNLYAPVKNQQKMLFAPNGRGNPMILQWFFQIIENHWVPEMTRTLYVYKDYAKNQLKQFAIHDGIINPKNLKRFSLFYGEKMCY
jgi:hypothetical protein